MDNPDIRFELISEEYYGRIVDELIRKYEEFRNYPREFIIKAFRLVNHTFNAFITRHFFYSQFFKSDEELIEFLYRLVDSFFDTESKILE